MYGTNVMLLLNALVQGESTIDSLISKIYELSSVRLSRSSAYVQLDRLEREGLASSRLGDATDKRGRKRRFYKISANGIAYLAQFDAVRGGVSLA
ncbi:MAG: hypothetical protein ED559_10135 [Phycisphaera sp.]|nr:MAG: hypothetical protein ED559_10135 [Phycisphaera sp.]